MPATAHPVSVPAGAVSLDGDLALPDGAAGIVLFAHGSGSGRHSPRNQLVARHLGEHGLGTLLVDLLTTAEEAAERRGAQLRFDIPFLAGRLESAAGWLERDRDAGTLPLGLFGASTGAAAALTLAGRRPARVRAVVSRGGRPDLTAPELLAEVRAPTLLIVGGDDEPVVGMNRTALEQLEAVAELQIVPGATHLFEEPGALERVAELAAAWFGRHLAGG